MRVVLFVFIILFQVYATDYFPLLKGDVYYFSGWQRTQIGGVAGGYTTTKGIIRMGIVDQTLINDTIVYRTRFIRSVRRFDASLPITIDSFYTNIADSNNYTNDTSFQNIMVVGDTVRFETGFPTLENTISFNGFDQSYKTYEVVGFYTFYGNCSTCSCQVSATPLQLMPFNTTSIVDSLAVMRSGITTFIKQVIRPQFSKTGLTSTIMFADSVGMVYFAEIGTKDFVSTYESVIILISYQPANGAIKIRGRQIGNSHKTNMGHMIKSTVNLQGRKMENVDKKTRLSIDETPMYQIKTW